MRIKTYCLLGMAFIAGMMTGELGSPRVDRFIETWRHNCEVRNRCLGKRVVIKFNGIRGVVAGVPSGLFGNGWWKVRYVSRGGWDAVGYFQPHELEVEE